MWCAACDGETPTRPCVACGADPLVDGRYELEGVLGRGATATTWRARRLADGLLVAAKEVSLRVRPAPKAMELLTREQRVLAELDHPALPRQLESFETGRGRTRSLWLVQTLIEGRTLAEEARTRRYDEREVLAIVAELADILDYLHTRSPPIVHRDVKPGNVLRRPDGRLALVDFGSVRDVLKDPDLGGSTVTGTFGYMAPEQFAGDAVPATDLYALGALAAALLTRRDPHSMLDGRELAWKRFAKVSTATAQLVDALLDDDVRKRPRAAAAVAREARRLAVTTDDPVLPQPPPRPVAPLPDPARLPVVVPRPPAAPDDRSSAQGAFILGVSVLFVTVSSLALAPPAPHFGNLAEWHSSAPPRGTSLVARYEDADWAMSGGGRDVYRVRADDDVLREGHPTLRLEPLGDTDGQYGTWMRVMDATPYRGLRVRISAWTRTEGATARADFWSRAQGWTSPSDGPGLAGDYTPLGADDGWTLQTHEFDVPEVAMSLQYGVGLAGPGTLWLDEPTIEVVRPRTWTP